MKRIQLWLVSKDGAAVSAVPVDEVQNTETEQLLEDILVASPELVEPGLKLIGRQVPTDGGPLDLLGVDQNGRLTVFELKRGTLTRDAVAQSLDCASDLKTYEFERLAALVREYSGRIGIDKIEDFEDWYSREYPGSTDALAEAPRIVLIGLGVDDRARRIVQFLAERGTEIQLLTFYGFRRDDQLFLARESVTPSVREHGTVATKEGNLEALRGRAKGLGLLRPDRLIEIEDDYACAACGRRLRRPKLCGKRVAPMGWLGGTTARFPRRWRDAQAVGRRA